MIIIRTMIVVILIYNDYDICMQDACISYACSQKAIQTDCYGGNGMPEIVWESTFVKKSEREREQERPVVRETDWPSCQTDQ